MKTNPHSRDRRLAATSLALPAFAILAFAVPANADINERKVLRDASGLFRGVATGGTYRVTYDSGVPAPFSFTGPTADFTERARFKDGRSAGVITDDDLEGSGAATAAGTQNNRVTRGGKRVLVSLTRGILREDDGADKGPWTGGKAVGTLDDKGRIWKALSTASAHQRNSSVPGNPPDHTRTVTGRKISGKG